MGRKRDAYGLGTGALCSASMFLVQKRPCSSCIYRKTSTRDIGKLEAQVADPKMYGFFRDYRVCHHAPDVDRVCCKGFWNRHKNKFTLGQLAQRLGLVRFVTLDRFKRSP